MELKGEFIVTKDQKINKLHNNKGTGLAELPSNYLLPYTFSGP
jgi:hypothetical protein